MIKVILRSFVVFLMLFGVVLGGVFGAAAVNYNSLVNEKIYTLTGEDEGTDIYKFHIQTISGVDHEYFEYVGENSGKGDFFDLSGNKLDKNLNKLEEISTLINSDTILNNPNSNPSSTTATPTTATPTTATPTTAKDLTACQKVNPTCKEVSGKLQYAQDGEIFNFDSKTKTGSISSTKSESNSINSKAVNNMVLTLSGTDKKKIGDLNNFEGKDSENQEYLLAKCIANKGPCDTTGSLAKKYQDNPIAADSKDLQALCDGKCGISGPGIAVLSKDMGDTTTSNDDRIYDLYQGLKTKDQVAMIAAVNSDSKLSKKQREDQLEIISGSWFQDAKLATDLVAALPSEVGDNVPGGKLDKIMVSNIRTFSNLVCSNSGNSISCTTKGLQKEAPGSVSCIGVKQCAEFAQKTCESESTSNCYLLGKLADGYEQRQPVTLNGFGNFMSWISNPDPNVLALTSSWGNADMVPDWLKNDFATDDSIRKGILGDLGNAVAGVFGLGDVRSASIGGYDNVVSSGVSTQYGCTDENSSANCLDVVSDLRATMTQVVPSTLSTNPGGKVFMVDYTSYIRAPSSQKIYYDLTLNYKLKKLDGTIIEARDYLLTDIKVVEAGKTGTDSPQNHVHSVEIAAINGTLAPNSEVYLNLYSKYYTKNGSKYVDDSVVVVDMSGFSNTFDGLYTDISVNAQASSSTSANAANAASWTPSRSDFNR